MANVIFNKVIAKDGKTARERYAEMVKQDGVFYLVEDDLYLKDVLLSANIASEIGVEDVAAHFEGSTVEEALAELAEMAAAKKVWFTDDSAGQSDYAKVYKLWQGANAPDAETDPATLLGTINIPKDKVIQSGSIVVIYFDNTDNTLHEGSISGPDVTELIVGSGGTATEADAGKYLKLVLQNVPDAVYISVKDFGGAYTGGTTPEATVNIDGSNVITVTIGKVDAQKIIYQQATPEEYVRVEAGATFDADTDYYIYDSVIETYTVDPTVDASNFDDKVAAGLFIKNEAVPEVSVKEKVQDLETKVGGATFDGTQAEWDILPDSEKAKYTYVNIIGDYEPGIPVMTGATADEDGTSGLTPVPHAGDQNKYFKGDGTWAEIADVDPIQVTTLPTASADIAGRTVQYLGLTSGNLVNGYFYQCQSDGNDIPTYIWVNIPVMDAAGSDAEDIGYDPSTSTMAAENVQDAIDELHSAMGSMLEDVVPTFTSTSAPMEPSSQIWQYVGTTNGDFTNGYFYKVEETSTPGVYQWTRVNVQPNNNAETDGIINSMTNKGSKNLYAFNTLYLAKNNSGWKYEADGFQCVSEDESVMAVWMYGSLVTVVNSTPANDVTFDLGYLTFGSASYEYMEVQYGVGIKPGHYILSGGANLSNSCYLKLTYKNNSDPTDTGVIELKNGEIEFEIKSGYYWNLYLVVKAGTTPTNPILIYPMVRDAAISNSTYIAGGYSEERIRSTVDMVSKLDDKIQMKFDSIGTSMNIFGTKNLLLIPDEILLTNGWTKVSGGVYEYESDKGVTVTFSKGYLFDVVADNVSQDVVVPISELFNKDNFEMYNISGQLPIGSYVLSANKKGDSSASLSSSCYLSVIYDKNGAVFDSVDVTTSEEEFNVAFIQSDYNKVTLSLVVKSGTTNNYSFVAMVRDSYWEDTQIVASAPNNVKLYDIINSLEDSKADAATTIAGYGITDAYTKTEIDGKISTTYKPKGNAASVAVLPSLTVEHLGEIYNMTTDFTTTSDFAEGAGIAVKAGNEVGIIDVGTEQSPSYKYTVLGGFVDLSGKQDVLVAGTNISIAADGKTISATDTTYESKTAVSGGTDVSLVTTGEKYTWNNAEPDSLTSAQVAALLALLQ